MLHGHGAAGGDLPCPPEPIDDAARRVGSGRLPVHRSSTGTRPTSAIEHLRPTPTSEIRQARQRGTARHEENNREYHPDRDRAAGCPRAAGDRRSRLGTFVGLCPRGCRDESGGHIRQHLITGSDWRHAAAAARSLSGIARCPTACSRSRFAGRSGCFCDRDRRGLVAAAAGAAADGPRRRARPTGCGSAGYPRPLTGEELFPSVRRAGQARRAARHGLAVSRRGGDRRGRPRRGRRRRPRAAGRLSSCDPDSPTSFPPVVRRPARRRRARRGPHARRSRRGDRDRQPCARAGESCHDRRSRASRRRDSGRMPLRWLRMLAIATGGDHPGVVPGVPSAAVLLDRRGPPLAADGGDSGRDGGCRAGATPRRADRPRVPLPSPAPPRRRPASACPAVSGRDVRSVRLAATRRLRDRELSLRRAANSCRAARLPALRRPAAHGGPLPRLRRRRPRAARAAGRRRSGSGNLTAGDTVARYRPADDDARLESRCGSSSPTAPACSRRGSAPSARSSGRRRGRPAGAARPGRSTPRVDSRIDTQPVCGKTQTVVARSRPQGAAAASRSRSGCRRSPSTRATCPHADDGVVGRSRTSPTSSPNSNGRVQTPRMKVGFDVPSPGPASRRPR